MNTRGSLKNKFYDVFDNCLNVASLKFYTRKNVRLFITHKSYWYSDTSIQSPLLLIWFLISLKYIWYGTFSV